MNPKRKSAAAAGPQGDTSSGKSAKKEEGCSMVEEGPVVIKEEYKTSSKDAADG